MNRILKETRFELSEVNERLLHDAAGFVAEQERRYRLQIEAVADGLAAGLDGLRFVMLCGPSSAGKTTTARLLCEALSHRAVRSVMVSLDDFYRDLADIPLQEDGDPDLESPAAIDVPRLHACMEELVRTGHTRLPLYDFGTRRPKEDTVPLAVQGNTVVFLEGVHAFAPSVTEGVRTCGTEAPRVYVNVMSRFTDGDEVLLGRRDVRLSRRLLRDERARSTSFYRTMTMWDDVIRGLTTYILPYASDAEYTVDTANGYEPAVMATPMRERLPSLYGTEYEQQARRLYEAFGRFVTLPTAAVPTNSVLREFA